MEKYFLFVLIAIVFKNYGQDLNANLIVEKSNFNVVSLNTNENILFLNLINQKNDKLISPTHIKPLLKNIFVYNLDDLSLKYETNLINDNKDRVLMNISDDGKFFLANSPTLFTNVDFSLFDDTGKETSFKVKKWLPKGFTQKNSYLDGKNFISFGYSYKKGSFGTRNNRVTQIFVRNLDNFETKIHDLSFPDEFIGENINKYPRAFNFSNDGFMVLFKRINGSYRETSLQEYLVVKYDYEGKILNTLVLPVHLESKHKIRFCSSNTTERAYDNFPFKTSDPVATIFSTGMIIWDKKEQFFYTYSSVIGTDNEEGGYQVDKFSKEGNLVWSKYFKVFSSLDGVRLNGKWTYTNLNVYKEDLFFYNKCLYGNEYQIYLTIDKNTGKLKRSTLFNFQDQSRISKNINPISFTFKGNLDNMLTGELQRASFLSKKFKNYIENQHTNENEFKYYVEFKDDYLIAIENDIYNKSFRLFKFPYD